MILILTGGATSYGYGSLLPDPTVNPPGDESYLSDMILIFDTRDKPRRKEITAGSAEFSILNTDVWNVYPMIESYGCRCRKIFSW